METLLCCADNALMLVNKTNDLTWTQITAAVSKLEESSHALPETLQQDLTIKYSCEAFCSQDYEEWSLSLLYCDNGDADWEIEQPRLSAGGLFKDDDDEEKTKPLKKKIDDAVFNQALYGFLKKPVEHRSTIIQALAALLSKVHHCSDSKKKVLESSFKAVRGIMCLLNPEPGAYESCLEDVEYLVTEDKKLMRAQNKSQKSFLHQVGQGKSFLTVLHNDEWKGIHSDYLKRSGAESDKGKEFQALTAKLVLLLAGIQGRANTDEQQVSTILGEFKANIDYYKSAFRPGATDNIVQLAQNIVTILYQKAISSNGADATKLTEVKEMAKILGLQDVHQKVCSSLMALSEKDSLSELTDALAVDFSEPSQVSMLLEAMRKTMHAEKPSEIISCLWEAFVRLVERQPSRVSGTVDIQFEQTTFEVFGLFRSSEAFTKEVQRLGGPRDFVKESVQFDSLTMTVMKLREETKLLRDTRSRKEHEACKKQCLASRSKMKEVEIAL